MYSNVSKLADLLRSLSDPFSLQTECSSSPADSVPLFWTSVAMLAISYAIIAEIIILIFAIVFFLPMVIYVMRALGLGDRLPRAGIQPETGKISQKVVDEIKLVYYTPAEEEGEDGNAGSTQDRIMQAALEVGETMFSSTIPQATPTDVVQGQSMRSKVEGKKRGGWARLFMMRRRTPSDAALGNGKAAGSKRGELALNLKYPLHPIPINRATCSICLCDFERPEEAIRNAGTELSGGWKKAVEEAETKKSKKKQKKEDKQEDAVIPEPLRLLECSHVFHVSDPIFKVLRHRLTCSHRNLAWMSGSPLSAGDALYARHPSSKSSPPTTLQLEPGKPLWIRSQASVRAKHTVQQEFSTNRSQPSVHTTRTLTRP